MQLALPAVFRFVIPNPTCTLLSGMGMKGRSGTRAQVMLHEGVAWPRMEEPSDASSDI